MDLPLPIVVEIAPGTDPSASPSTWDYTDEGLRWRAKAGIRFSNGRDDEDEEVKPGSAEVVFDNRDGDLSPRNVLGKWYGDLRRNTPIRFGLDTVHDDFPRTRSNGWGTEPQSGLNWFHTNSGNWFTEGGYGKYTSTAVNSNYALLEGAVGQDVDMYNSAAINATPTGGSWVHATVVRRNIDTGFHYRVYTEFGTSGQISVKIARFTGSSVDITSLTATGVTYIPNDIIHTHVRAVGKTIQTRVWKNLDPEPTVWHVTVEDAQVFGAYVGFYEWRLASGPASITISVTDIRVRTSLWSGQVPEWPVRWPDKSGADCIAPVSASGVLRLLEQAQPTLTDPISQQLSAYNPQAYWTLQDGSDAKSAGSALARRRGVSASVVEGSLGSDDAPGGALSALTLNTVGSSRLTGSVSTWSIGAGGWSVIFYTRFPTLPAASPARPLVTISAYSSVAQFVITADAATLNLTGYDLDGGVMFSTGGSTYSIDPTTWFAVEVEARQVGGSIAYRMTWHQIGSESFQTTGSSIVGSLGRVTLVTLTPPVDGTLFSHLWVGPDTVPFVDGKFMRVSAGFAGETDNERINRVLTDAGIDVFIHPGAGIKVGAQPRNATALEVARDAEKAGWGVLYEFGAILAYMPYSARLNQANSMTLDWAAGHLAESPEPVDDDLDLINRWTSRRPNGSERTSESPTSIAENGLYADGDEVNVLTDDQLEDDSAWHVAVGARDVLRWPRVEIDLVRNRDLIPYWLNCRIGSRISIINLPRQVAGEKADLIITGYEQEMTRHRWRVTMTCAPARPWGQAGVWGITRGDSKTCVVDEDVTPTETLINVRSTFIEDMWAPAGGYQINIGGEPIQVTSATVPTGSPGAYTQTIDGVRHPTLAKEHFPGDPVRLNVEFGRWSIRFDE